MGKEKLNGFSCTPSPLSHEVGLLSLILVHTGKQRISSFLLFRFIAIAVSGALGKKPEPNLHILARTGASLDRPVTFSLVLFPVRSLLAYAAWPGTGAMLAVVLCAIGLERAPGS